ncbi:MAG: hypothetical protein QM487_05880 [Candidatus Marithrix sp.]
MNISNRISCNQSGIALIIFLTVIVLGTATFLVSQANNSRFQREINAQKQTAKVLRQAKEALLGFAAVYAKTHTAQPQGYLPCPDLDGNGSSESYCGNKGESILGRFPWRTLGLPPLKDGNNDCLWYAVSGNYKDKPKSALTSDTPGLFIVENMNGDKIAGAVCTSSSCVSEDDEAKQTIAIIFSPGKILDGQNRTSTGIKTSCGSENTLAPIDDINNLDNINKAENYLDKFIVSKGTDYTIDNSKGKNESALADNWGKKKLPTEINSVFIKAPLTYYTDNNGKTDNERVIFNDTLMLITRKDFEPIYERMDLWVAKKASLCLEQSVGSTYEENFLNTFEEAIGDLETPDTGTYRAESEHITLIEEYINDSIKKCETKCDDTQNACLFTAQTCDDINACKTECNDTNTECKSDIYIKNEITGCTSIEAKDIHRIDSISVEGRFPLAADINDETCFNVSRYKNEDDNTTDYKLACKPTDKRFGRIPNVPDNTNNGMLQEWTNKCFMNYWWDEWKEKIFYAVEDDYAPNNTIHFWIRSIKRTWNGETNADFDGRRDDNKEDTFARIQESDTKKWELATIPIPPANEVLQLNNEIVNKFTILVSGRRINTQARAEDSDKMDINNYLEGDNNLNYNYINSNTCPVDPDILPPPPPTCIFERKRTDKDFNDIVCKDRWKDCTIPK